MFRREWMWALAAALLLSTVLALPYILGHSLARPGVFFTGLIMNPQDAQSYFAKMLQGYDGKWLYTIPFTVEKHAPAFLGGFYLALGHIARWFNAPLQLVWHLSRFAFDVFLFLMTFVFISTFLKDTLSRWTAFVLTVLGSGMGWLLFILKQPYWLGAFPVDFKMPEAHLFFSALTFPHVAFGTGILLLSFWLILKSSRGEKKSWLYALSAGFSNLILGIVYPFIIFLPLASVGIYWTVGCIRIRRIHWKQSFLYVVPFLVPLPLFLYYAYTYQINDVMRSWAAQAVTRSPPWPHYVIAFGIMLVLAFLPYLSRRRSITVGESPTFLWSWVVSSALLVYAPLNPQRRFVQGLQVPLAILATVGLFTFVLPLLQSTAVFRRLVARPRYSSEGLRRLVIFAFLAFMSLSNLYLFSDVTLTATLRQPYPFFRSKDEVDAADWLRDNVAPEARILTAYETGNFVAARSGNHVTLGHWAETVNRDIKTEETKRFFDIGTDDQWRKSLLDWYGVSYVWYGEQERALGSFLLEPTGYLHAVYSAGDVVIYAYRP